MKKIISLSIFVVLSAAICSAQNPIITTSYTPDPAPYVYGDKLYMFTGHDEDDATYFKMNDWQVFSTEDMVNWTYLGTPISTETFKWAFHGDRAWASQAIERNGKWYWYVCLNDADKKDVLAVAVAVAAAVAAAVIFSVIIFSADFCKRRCGKNAVSRRRTVSPSGMDASAPIIAMRS